jgi:putative aldouronate transport system substrate-binding protein
VEFEWEVPPTTSYYERLNVTMASGDLPDLIWSGINENFWNWVDSGLVLAIDEYIEKSPNIQEVVNPALMNKVRRIDDGKIYGITRPQPIFVQGTYWRKDWLDALGLPVPSTVDECITAWRAIADSDFDGNGKKDTYGFSMSPDLGPQNSLFPALGIAGKNKTGGQWLLDENGKVTHRYLMSNYIDGIEFLADLYDQGIIDKEYILNKTAPDIEGKMNQGRVGSHFADPMKASWQRVLQKTEEVFPEAEIVFAPPVNGPGGQGSSINPANDWGVWFLTVAVEDPERLMAFLDLMHSKEWVSNQIFGIEGIHYESYDRENEILVRTEEQAAKWNLDYNPRFWFTRRPDLESSFYATSTTYRRADFMKAFAYNSQKEFFYPEVSYGYYPAALKQLDMEMPDWRNAISEVLNKIIIGEASREEFTALIEKISSAGLDAAVAEMQDYYDKMN